MSVFIVQRFSQLTTSAIKAGVLTTRLSDSGITVPALLLLKSSRP